MNEQEQAARMRPKYADVATFLRAPVRTSGDGVAIGLVGVPFDNGCSGRSGQRSAPRYVREHSLHYARSVHHPSGIRPFDVCPVGDLGDCVVDHPYHLEQAHQEIEEYYDALVSAGIVPLSVGGDHSISMPILRALSRKHGPVALIHFDAHCDTWDIGYGSSVDHTTTFRRAAEAGTIDPGKSIQIGIRGIHRDVWSYSYEAGMRVVYVEEMHEIGIKSVIEEIVRTVDSSPVYISFDIDALDPSFAPGTGAPELGGLTTFEMQQLLRGCIGLNLVGADVVEVLPDADPTGITGLAAGGALFELLAVAAASAKMSTG